MTWPTQAECGAFYGNPRNPRDNTKPSPSWEAANLVRVQPPFAIFYEGKPVKAGILIHKKCAESLSRILAAIWEAAGRSQSTIDAWGMSNYAGSYNYRLSRGSGWLSMHGYAVAVDFDPERNAFHDETPNFAKIPQVVDAFEKEGWIWGGRWSGRGCDGMHFQAARVR